ncbi:hypothetical protein [Tropicimonas sp. S265A]|uniref:hypothetical protein n=1 Tax=Tropicimonas sp. S265A TaxID=3415134 RepID=UPI003C7B2F4E
MNVHSLPEPAGLADRLRRNLCAPVLTDADLKPALSAPDPKIAAGRIAEGLASVATNAAAAEAQSHIDRIKRDEARTTEKLTPMLELLKTYLRYEVRYECSGVKVYRLPVGDRIKAGFELLLSIAALVMAVYVVAAFVKGSTFSLELSGSWLRSIGYAFPVVLAATGIAAFVAFEPDLDKLRRIGKRIVLLAVTSFVVWALLTGWLFIGLEGTEEALFSMDEEESSLMETLFPTSALGTALLLTHVLSDVLFSAALGIRAVLRTRTEKGRVRDVRICEDYTLTENLIKPLEARLDDLARERAGFEAVLSDTQSIREKTVEEAHARIAHLQRQRDAYMAEAETRFIQLA